MMKFESQWDKYEDGEPSGTMPFVDFTECGITACSTQTEIRGGGAFYTVILVLSGSMTTKDTGMIAKKNEVILIPKFSRCVLTANESSEILRVIFNASESYFSSPSGSAMHLSVHELSEKLLRLYNTYKFERSVPGLTDAILTDILNDIYKATYKSSAELTVYDLACKYIEKNSDRAITVKSVSDALGYSREYLSRVVRSVGGVSLSKKIASYRLERIKKLSALNNESAEDIAKALNFYSAELLCKYVKYHTGISFSEYKTL